jgi:hypothetical protein
MPLALIENNPQPQSLQSDEETGYFFFSNSNVFPSQIYHSIYKNLVAAVFTFLINFYLLFSS